MVLPDAELSSMTVSAHALSAQCFHTMCIFGLIFIYLSDYMQSFLPGNPYKFRWNGIKRDKISVDRIVLSKWIRMFKLGSGVTFFGLSKNGILRYFL